MRLRLLAYSIYCGVKCIWVPAGQLQPSWQWLSHVWVAWGVEQLSGHELLHSKNSMLYGHSLSVEANTLISLYQWLVQNMGHNSTAADVCTSGPEHSNKLGIRLVIFRYWWHPYSRNLHSSIVGARHLHVHTLWRTLRWFCRGQSQSCLQSCTYQPYKLYWRTPHPDGFDNCWMEHWRRSGHRFAEKRKPQISQSVIKIQCWVIYWSICDFVFAHKPFPTLRMHIQMKCRPVWAG